MCNKDCGGPRLEVQPTLPPDRWGIPTCSDMLGNSPGTAVCSLDHSPTAASVLEFIANYKF